MSLAALLLLADGRLPAGGHAHSGGVETACARGLVHDVASLAAFLTARLHTAGLLAAAAAAQAARLARAEPDGHPGRRADLTPTPATPAPATPAPATATPAGCAPATTTPAGLALAALDRAVDARTPSPAARLASRAQGRSLLRLATAAWPHPAYAGLRTAHHPVVLGVTAVAAGCSPRDAATAAGSHAVSGPATAAVRLLGLDPGTVLGVQAALAPAVDRLAAAATAARTLPHAGSPLLDLLAEEHAAGSVTLFAS